MIRILTLYVVPISFAIILLIGLVGNTLVIFVVSYHIIVIMDHYHGHGGDEDRPIYKANFKPGCHHQNLCNHQ